MQNATDTNDLGEAVRETNNPGLYAITGRSQDRVSLASESTYISSDDNLNTSESSAVLTGIELRNVATNYSQETKYYPSGDKWDKGEALKHPQGR